MPNFALLSKPGALLRKVPPLLCITFVCPLQSGFSFCSPFFRNSACSNLDESHGRKPAMRVSERVRPTADLTPAPHKMCNKLLKFASYRCCCRCGLLNWPTRPDRRMLGCRSAVPCPSRHRRCTCPPPRVQLGFHKLGFHKPGLVLVNSTELAPVSKQSAALKDPVTRVFCI